MLLAHNRILTTFLTHYTGICLYRGSGNGSLQAMGQVHHKWSSLEWAQRWLWSIGMLSLWPVSCLDEGNHLHGSGCECTDPSPGEWRREGEDVLGPIWSGSKGFACLKGDLFLDTVGTDGSSVSSIALLQIFFLLWQSSLFFIFCHWKGIIFLIAAML